MSASEVIDRARDEGRSALTEAEAKQLFADRGIPVTDHGVATSVEEAVAEADRIGYPVVAKVSSPQVQHKTEWADGSGVQVGLTDEEAVRTAAEEILSAADAQGIDAGVLVEAQLDTEAGTELIVGGVRDRSFGPAVLVGLGGVFTEVFEDTSHRLAPLSTADARSAIEALQSVVLLKGYRGRPPADLDALAEAVRQVGDLVAEHEAIAEVDVNPLLANEEGVVALDALVTLRDER